MGEKTLQPTEQKLRDARKKGQVPRSKLFGAATVTFGALIGSLIMSTESSARLVWWTSKVLSLENAQPVEAVFEAVRILAWCVWPTLVGAMVGSIVSGLVTAGFEVHFDTLTPDLERLDPVNGLKRLISKKQFIDIGKALFVALFVATIIWSELSDAAPIAFRAMAHDGGKAMVAVLSLVSTTVLKTSSALFVLGLGDYLLARRRHRKELMMSHEDLKQEYKNAEGDPHAKSKRKSEHKKLAQGGPRRSVKTATAVVVNPTHIAIAIRYDELECDAPYIVAKGRDEDAMSIRREAQESNIPIVKDVPMARALVYYDVGEEVPEELYQAAAAVLKVAQEESERRQRERQGEQP